MDQDLTAAPEADLGCKIGVNTIRSFACPERMLAVMRVPARKKMLNFFELPVGFPILLTLLFSYTTLFTFVMFVFTCSVFAHHMGIG